MQFMDLQISCGWTQAIKQEKVYTQGQLKLTYINFVILNSHVTVTYIFKIYQKQVFLHSHTEKLKIAVLDFFKQENCLCNKMTSVRKSYISKSVKK